MLFSFSFPLSNVLPSVVRIAVPLVTRSTLEVVIPEYAVPKLIAKSKSKLAQISEVCVIRSISPSL